MYNNVGVKTMIREREKIILVLYCFGYSLCATRNAVVKIVSQLIDTKQETIIEELNKLIKENYVVKEENCYRLTQKGLEYARELYFSEDPIRIFNLESLVARYVSEQFSTLKRFFVRRVERAE